MVSGGASNALRIPLGELATLPPGRQGVISGFVCIGGTVPGIGLRSPLDQVGGAGAAVSVRRGQGQAGSIEKAKESGGLLSRVKSFFGRVEEWMLTITTQALGSERCKEAMSKAMVYLSPLLGTSPEFGEPTSTAFELQQNPDGSAVANIAFACQVSGASRRGEARVEAIIVEEGDLTLQKIFLDGQEVPMSSTALPPSGSSTLADVVDV